MTAPSQATLVLVGDFRSPHARTWMTACERIFAQVIALSSFPQDTRVASRGVRRVTPWLRGIFSDTVPATSRRQRAGVQVRHRFRWHQAQDLAAAIQRTCLEVEADHVHALRLPWEGVAAQLTGRPFSVSLWGHDLTTQASQSALLRQRTKTTLRECAGLTADCHRDVTLACAWGLPATTPTAVIPGDVSLQIPEQPRPPRSQENVLRVCCPRGLLPHVRWKEMLISTAWLNAAGVRVDLTILDVPKDRIPVDLPFVRFRPRLPQAEMHALALSTDVVLSPTTSDGMPNSVLEFVAAGAVPVLGDLPSTRELVEPGVSGLLCDPLDPTSIADALTALVEPRRREQLAARALETVRRDYCIPGVLERLARFFDRVLGGGQ